MTSVSSKLHYLFFSQRNSNCGFVLDNLLKDFDDAAGRLLPQWTRDRAITESKYGLALPPRKLTTSERQKLQKCLFDIITPKFEEMRKLGRETRSMSRSLSDTSNVGEPITTTSKSTRPHLAVDDRSIPFNLGEPTPAVHHKKRDSEQFESIGQDRDEMFKKPRLPGREKSPVHEINKAIDEVFVRTTNSPTDFNNWRQTKPLVKPGTQSFMGAADAAASLSRLRDKSFTSADTSFVSEASSVFSLPPKNTGYAPVSSLTSTQTTVQSSFGSLDQDETDLCISMIKSVDDLRPPSSSTNYGSTIADEDLGAFTLGQSRKSFVNQSASGVYLATSRSDDDSIRYPELPQLPDIRQPTLKRLENSLGDIFRKSYNFNAVTGIIRIKVAESLMLSIYLTLPTQQRPCLYPVITAPEL